MDGDHDAYAFDMDDCGVDRDGGDGGRSFRRFGEAPVHKAPAGFCSNVLRRGGRRADDDLDAIVGTRQGRGFVLDRGRRSTAQADTAATSRKQSSGPRAMALRRLPRLGVTARPRFVAQAGEHRQARIAREPRVGPGALAQPERAALRLDDPGVAAARTTRRGRNPPFRPRAPQMAERVGFEPTKSFDSALFKSAAINRSATSPRRRIARDAIRSE